MSFAAFTSALIVRQGAAPDWQHFTLPPVLYLNTLVIIASSITLEIARRRIAAFMGGVQKQESGQAESGALAVHNSVSGPALRCRADLCLDATPVAGLRTSHQRELLLLLRADGSSCAARARRPRRPGPRDREAESVRAAKKHSGRDFALLAFHGCAVGVSAFAALDEALKQLESKVGGNVSQADLSIHGQVSRSGATE